MATYERTFSWTDGSNLIPLATVQSGREVMEVVVKEPLTLGAYDAMLEIQSVSVGDGVACSRCVLAPFHQTWLGSLPTSLMSQLGMQASWGAALSTLGPTEGLATKTTSLELLQPAGLSDVELLAFAAVRDEADETIEIDFRVEAKDGAVIATGAVEFNVFRAPAVSP